MDVFVKAHNSKVFYLLEQFKLQKNEPKESKLLNITVQAASCRSRQQKVNELK